MQYWSLTGHVPYEEARALQLELVELRARDLVPDTVLFLEHEPVITRGRGLQWTGAPRERHMPMAQLLPPGISFAESERGGDLTYHGPGQLVIYPIVKLDGQGFGPRQDVAAFLRRFENALVAELRELGLEAGARENATGVWVSGFGAADRKLASIGIAVRRWVTYHGMAVNLVNDLSPFGLISPCGFQPEVMTRLKDLVAMGDAWRTEWEGRLARRMGGGAIEPLSMPEARARLAALSSACPSRPEGAEALSGSSDRT